jgi:hypothetical protein
MWAKKVTIYCNSRYTLRILEFYIIDFSGDNVDIVDSQNVFEQVNLVNRC